MDTSQLVRGYIEEVRSTLSRLPVEEIERIVEVLEKARAERRRVFILGNGGSAATASHFACDLGKGAMRPDRPRMRAIALTDNLPSITAWANDTTYENVFTEQLEAHLEEGDIVIGISGSGNSPNVLNALKLANSKGATTISLTGFDGGKSKDIARHCIVVPNNSMEQIEDIHLLLEHIVPACLRESDRSC
ncbi:SIS domain-containing protein [Chloroflexota bacterium]